jgi:hypothetical protein
MKRHAKKKPAMKKPAIKRSAMKRPALKKPAACLYTAKSVVQQIAAGDLINMRSRFSRQAVSLQMYNIRLSYKLRRDQWSSEAAENLKHWLLKKNGSVTKEAALCQSLTARQAARPMPAHLSKL